MENWKYALVTPDTPILKAVEKINAASTKLALVVNAEKVLLGTLSDGDVRRGLLAGIQLSDPVDRFMSRTPTTALVGETRQAILKKMRKLSLHQIPVLDHEGRVVDLKLIDDYLLIPDRKNWVVIMAGGPGTRLKELTRDVPKPMLPVGDRPLLETSICRFVEQGFRHIWLAVNYHASKIKDHFGDGKEFGAEIHYLREGKRLGTAGALSLLPHIPEKPILVTNGDLLANIDYCDMIDQHISASASATMAVREYEYQIPYGVVKTTEGNIAGLEEKPVHRVVVNAGVYVLSPEVISKVPRETFFDMTELFEALIAEGQRTRCHLVNGYWRDIGCHEDLAKACSDFNQVFDK